WPGAMTPSPYVCHDCCCPLGALAIAAGIDDYAKAELALEHTPALRLAVAALAAQISDHPGDSGFSDRARRRRNLKEIVSWNDAAGRTAVEVTAALRAAAAHVVARR
ncbi:MAG: hypothetical protein J2P19_25665, partial [Pseudonocardia sp.]|nr:hypothetical protein [Pseudonocardia sp.]